jgi:hypothetical protein
MALPYLHSWTAGDFNRIRGQFGASTQREPPVPEGATEPVIMTVLPVVIGPAILGDAISGLS